MGAPPCAHATPRPQWRTSAPTATRRTAERSVRRRHEKPGAGRSSATGRRSPLVRTIVIDLSGDVELPGDGDAGDRSDSNVAGGDSLDRDALVDALSSVSSAAVTIRRDSRYPGWERGDPCPECGNETLTVFEIATSSYHSGDGEFVRVAEGDVTGPQVSIGCPNCLTHLAHVPYAALRV